jgi:UDP-N-acetylglucosamine--N-acetylmuramyl-(pentapeptide) pyrophosphoryl-undecaprenol N-acetylglucosamine transferase
LTRAEVQARITFVGTGKNFERARVRAARYDYLALPGHPLPKNPAQAIRFLIDNFSGYFAAKRFLREQNVNLVVGLGGYASAAICRAAAALGVPYILLEQNAVPGRATRWLAPKADMVCSAFTQARTALTRAKRIRITGTPIRRDFLLRSARQNGLLEHRAPRLIVLGGSGGARALNEQVPWAIYKSQAALAGWEIVHQTGERDVASTVALYRKLGITARVVPFIENLPRVLRRSDLAISRAGGSTLAELAVCGVPAVLVPYPRAADDHQLANAKVFAGRGAARIVDARHIDGRFDNVLAKTLDELVLDDGLRKRMAHNMVRASKRHATKRISRLILKMLSDSGQIQSARLRNLC